MSALEPTPPIVLPIAAQLMSGVGNSPPPDELLDAEFAALNKEINDALEWIKNNAAKTIKDDAALLSVGKIIARSSSITASAENAHKRAKRPVIDAGRTIDGYFRSIGERIDAVIDPLRKAATAYQNAKDAAARTAAKAAADKLRAEAVKAEEKAATLPGQRGILAGAKAEHLHTQADEAAAKVDAKPADLTRVSGGGVTVSSTSKWGFAIIDWDAIPLDKLRPYLKRDAVETALRSYVNVHKEAASLAGVEFKKETKAAFR